MRSVLLPLLPVLLTGCDLLAVKSFVPCEDTGTVYDDDTGTACPAWWPDSDGDGWGDGTAVSQDFCEDPGEGWADQGDDCDDGDPTVHPGATEICNEVDDDCDTLVDGKDEDLDLSTASTWYPDLDDDGYGTEEGAVVDCEPPADFVAEAGDCDDSTELAAPDLTETCDDGVDNDCDTEVDEDCALAGSFPVDDLPLRFDGTTAGDQAGWSLGGPGDLDGDGIDDLVIGAPRASDPDEPSLIVPGAAYALPGPWSPGDGIIDLEGGATTTWRSGWSESRGGVAVALVPDLDGDGYDELLVGGDNVPSDFGVSGRAWLVAGPAEFGGDLDTGATATFQGPGEDAYLGRYLTAGGDLTYDGTGDVVVSAPLEDDAGTDAGKVYIYAGPVSGTYTPDDAWLSIDGPAAGALLGPVQGRSDLDGDGIDDLVMAAPGTSRIYVLPGPLTTGSRLDDAIILEGESPGDQAGSTLAGPGDVDGDGIDDLLVGGPTNTRAGTRAGAAWLVLGPLSADTPLETAATVFVGDATGDGAGSAVAATDLDGDGVPDATIGAPGSDDPLADAGLAALFYGPPASGTVALADADLRLLGPITEAALGASLRQAGDLDGDGLPDLSLAAPGAFGGQVWVLFGGTADLDSDKDVEPEL